MKNPPLYVVAYDIPTTKSGLRRYRKIVKIMDNYGDRVQYSVFECRLTKQNLQDLVQILRKVLD
ncbi:MAG: CRISPR-associated endonuclease Cas2, partial [Candidatus Hydrogenedentota bacterium]